MEQILRKAYNAGVKYPQTKEELLKFITLFNHSLENSVDAKERLKLSPQAIIAPHGEIYYSGFSTNLAHRLLAKKSYKRVVVISKSQSQNFDAIAISNFKKFQTPFGDLNIDNDYIDVISSHFPILYYNEDLTQEYTSEIQMNYIAYYQPKVDVIEILYNNTDSKLLNKLIYWLLEDTLTAVVISSNLSQNVPQELGNTLDTLAIHAIVHQDTAMLKEAEASSLEAIEALVKSTSKLNLSTHILDYRTSCEVSKDYNDCTGYMSAAFCKK